MKKSSKCPPDYVSQRGKESNPKSNLKNSTNIHTQGCTLTAPGRLRRPTFGLGRLKKNTGRPAGHPAVLFAVQRCGKAGD